jgi:hypothetical protein
VVSRAWATDGGQALGARQDAHDRDKVREAQLPAVSGESDLPRFALAAVSAELRCSGLLGGMERLTESSMIDIKNKSHAVTAEIVGPAADAEGVASSTACDGPATSTARPVSETRSHSKCADPYSGR